MSDSKFTDRMLGGGWELEFRENEGYLVELSHPDLHISVKAWGTDNYRSKESAMLNLETGLASLYMEIFGDDGTTS